MAIACRTQAHMLSAREFDFVSNISMSSRAPTEKQAQWLAAIYQRVRQ
jgi:hypothetical protein